MTDDRLLRTFRLLDEAVAPDASFADRLFEDLATDLGFRRGSEPASIGSRVRRALGLEGLPSGSAALRLAYLAAILGLLFALAVGTMFVASELRKDTVPPQLSEMGAPGLVRLSQAAYEAAPAIRMTIRLPDDQLATMASDGLGTWRLENPGESPGTFYLYDGARVGIYDGQLRTWSVGPVENGGPPYPLNDAFTWTHIEFPGLRATLSAIPCDDASALGESTVLGRPVDGVGCPGVGMEYWIDRESRLVLRSVAQQASPYFWGKISPTAVTEVTSFEEIASPDPAAFAWTGPAGANPGDAPLASTELVVGESSPAWTGRTIEGRPISMRDLGTPAAVLFITPACRSCPAAYDDFNAVATGIDGLTPVIVGSDDLGNVTGFVGQHPTGIPVVDDSGRALAEAWGITGEPALVLLDRNGSVAAALRGRLEPEDLRTVLAAHADGRAIPAARRAPAATPVPGDPTLDPGAPCDEALVTCLPVGSRMPQWSAPRLEGGTLGSADLAGKPALIWLMYFRCDGPCPAWVDDRLREFAAYADQYRGRAAFVILSGGERMPGDTAALLSRAGVEIPVAFDWDASISERWRMITGGCIVLDGAGRLAGVADEQDMAGAIELLDRALGAP